MPGETGGSRVKTQVGHEERHRWVIEEETAVCQADTRPCVMGERRPCVRGDTRPCVKMGVKQVFEKEGKR